MKNAILLPAFLLSTLALNAQAEDKLYFGDVADYPKEMVTYTTDDMGDTVANVTFYTCVVTAPKSFKSVADQRAWEKLKRDVKAAYPYAVLAKMKLAEMDAQLATIKGERERKAFNEKCEDELVAQFEKDMRNLTNTQGRILFKLLDRETGSTTYQIIKDRRGSFSAFMWQSVAFVFGNNLKSEYDPEGEDAKIEEVVELLELGLI
jgi:hypothetical protein